MSSPQTESFPRPPEETTGSVRAIDVVSAAESVAATGSVPVTERQATGGQSVSRRNLLGRKQRFEARRVRRIIRHIDPWSVLKLSLVFFLCVWVMFMVAVVIIWSIAESSGTIEKIEGFISDLGVAGWKLNGTFIFRQYGLFGLVMVFACTTATVVSTIVFNLISDLIGGVWISVIEEETSRPVPD